MHHNRYDYEPVIHRAPLRWPHDARVAVWVIPNVEYYDFNGQSTSLYPLGVSPDVLNYAWRDYGVRVGVWRLMELLDKCQIRGTVALNAGVCEHYPQIVKEGMKRNWEFMGHAITNSQLLNGLTVDEERYVIRTTLAKIEETVGRKPTGWLSPALAESRETPDILAEEGVQYVCDWCNDDQPYMLKVRSGRLISLPYSVELNDIPFFLGLKGTPEGFMRAIIDQFDVLYAEGKANGRVMALALHPFIIGVPYRLKYLAKALEHIARHPDVWLATGSEISQWYCDRYSVPPGRACTEEHRRE